MRFCVIDGQGGRIGAAMIRRLKQEYGEGVEVHALGTNAAATAYMMKSHANRGATGENAILHSIKVADVIIGPLSIVLANAMMGEVTPAIAAAVASCQAPKLLLPLNREGVKVAGVSPEPLPHLVEEIVKVHLKALLTECTKY